MVDLVFFGRKSVSARLLEHFVKLPNVNVVGVLTDSHLSNSPTSAVAKKHNLKLYRREELQEAICKQGLRFDLGISVLYWRKITPEIVSASSRGIINFHPAILPEFKGTGGYNLAILEMLEEWGISAHYVDESIDTGPIIDVSRFKISSESETAQSLEAKSMSHLEPFVKEVAGLALNSKNPLSSYPNVGGRYVSRVEMERMKVVNEGEDVDRKIRAFWFPPYSGAQVEIGGKFYSLVNEDILKEVAPKGETSLFS